MPDRLLAPTAGTLLGLSLPQFWVGLMLVYFLAETLRWLPAAGVAPPGQTPGGPLEMLPYLVLPTVALAGAPHIGLAMAALGVLLAASRVYAGLHYPTDIVSGWAIGVGLGLLVRQKGPLSAEAR